jgi:hypothetical protein
MDHKILIKYENKWVALTENRKKVVASANNIKDLDKKIKTLKQSNKVIYHHVLPFRSLAPSWQN